MENKENAQKGYLFSKKGFYVTAVVGLCAVVAAAAALRITTNRVKDDLGGIVTESTSPILSRVENDLSGVPDERQLSSEAKAEESSAAKSTQTEPSFARESTEKATSPTVESSTAQAAKIENTSFSLPLEGKTIKSFSLQTPVYSNTMGDYRTHGGVDIAGNEGEQVLSVGNGKVTRILADSMWGYIIEIDHGDFTARYIGLSQDGAVGIGDTVKAGQSLGTLGDIPIEKEDGLHLHFEVIKGETQIEPFAALDLTVAQ